MLKPYLEAGPPLLNLDIVVSYSPSSTTVKRPIGIPSSGFCTVLASVGVVAGALLAEGRQKTVGVESAVTRE